MKNFCLRTKTAVCSAGLVLLACCQQGAAQTFNTSSDLLIKGQQVMVDSPLITLFTTNLVQVTTNRLVLGEFPSFASQNDYTVQYAAPPAPPYTLGFEISTNNGSSWTRGTRYGTNCLVAISGQGDSFWVTNLVIRGFSHKYNHTNDLSGQRILLFTPQADYEAANKLYVDREVTANVPHDWSEYPATNSVTLGGQTVFWDSRYSTTTEASTNVSQTFRVYGVAMLQFEASSSASGSNVASQIAVTDTTVTIRIATNGVTSRPILYTTTDFIAGNWQLASLVAPLTESYPSSTGGYYTITFPRLAGDNFFTVYLASAADFKRIRTRVPLRIEAGLQVATNFVAADFVPVPGMITFAASNNALYSVSTTKTNLIVTP
jgi:hypothetical protein